MKLTELIKAQAVTSSSKGGLTPQQSYASRPATPTFYPKPLGENGENPQFCNQIYLKTLHANLFLEFGFTSSTSSINHQTATVGKTCVVLSNETAKQLFLALAELFDCNVQPKE